MTFFFQVSSFLPLLQSCCGSSILAIRELAVKAYVKLADRNDDDDDDRKQQSSNSRNREENFYLTRVKKILEDLKDEKGNNNAKKRPQNEIHGLLTLVSSVFFIVW